MAKQLFITGTGTDVGKTYVSALLVKKLKEIGSSAYFKPAMSGNDRDERGALIPGDARWVKDVSGIEQSLQSMCPYVYEVAYSPHLAAQLEGNPLQMDRVEEGLQGLQHYDFVTVEGCGGIICPLVYDERILWQEDVIRHLHLSCLIVADAGLGTINALALTLHYLRAKRIAIKGIVLNRFQKGNVLHEDNLKMCRELSDIPVLSCVAEGDQELPISAEKLARLYE